MNNKKNRDIKSSFIINKIQKWYKENKRRHISNNLTEFDTGLQIHCFHYNHQIHYLLYLTSISICCLLCLTIPVHAQTTMTHDNSSKNTSQQKQIEATQQKPKAETNKVKYRAAAEAFRAPKKSVTIFQTYNLFGMKKDGEIILPAEYELIKRLNMDTVHSQENGGGNLYKTIKKGKSGLINERGDILLENKYEGIEVLEGSSLIFIKVNDKWDAIDIFGNIQNPNIESNPISEIPKYPKTTTIISQSLQSFTKNNAGLIKFSKNNKFGLMKKSGKIIVPAKYDKLESFDRYGMAIMQLSSKYGTINKNGEVVLQPIYDAITKSTIRDMKSKNNSMHDHSYKVKKNDKYALFNLQGKQFTEFVFDEIYEQNYCRSAFIFAKNNKYGLISKQNKIIVEADYDAIGTPEFNCYFKSKKGEKFGYLTDEGELIAPKYKGIGHDYDSNYFYIMENDKFGVLNEKGKQIVPPKFINDKYHNIEIETLTYTDKATDKDIKNQTDKDKEIKVGDSLKKETVVILIQENGKYGMLNHEGKPLFASEYDSIDYRGQLFVLSQGKKKGIANINGTMIVPVSLLGNNEKYRRLNLDFISNTKIVFDGKAGILSPMGQWVIKPTKQEIDKIETGGFWSYPSKRILLYIIKRELTTPDKITTAQASSPSNSSKERWAVANIEGDYISDFISTVKPTLESDLVVFDKHGQFGVMDVLGNVLITPEYDAVKVKRQGIIVTQNDKVGKIDFQGKHILPITFDDVTGIDYDKYFLVKQKDKYGLYDAKGYKILPVKFDVISNAKNSLYKSDALIVAQGNRINLYDYLGNKLTKQNYGKIELFQDNIFAVHQLEQMDKVGLIDVHGNELLPIKFDIIRGAGQTNRVFWINKEGLWWLIDINEYKQTGKTLSKIGFEYIAATYTTTKGLLAVRSKGKYGFVDTKGNLAIPLEYDEVNEFNDYGIAKVVKNNQDMYIDIKGNEVKF